MERNKLADAIAGLEQTSKNLSSVFFELANSVPKEVLEEKMKEANVSFDFNELNKINDTLADLRNKINTMGDAY